MQNPKIAKIWKNKESGKLLKVAPWWEIPEPVLELSAKEAVQAKLSEDERKFKFGSLVQIGWLLCNENDVYFGVALSVEDQFEDVTDDPEAREEMEGK